MSDLTLSSSNLSYLEELYQSWKRDPSSVNRDWQHYFSHFERETPGFTAQTQIEQPLTDRAPSPRFQKSRDMVYKQSRVDSLIWAYRDVGYLYAKLNPLVGYLSPDLHYLYKQKAGIYEQLTLQEFGLDESDLDLEFSAGRALKPRKSPLREILKALDQTYCSSVGVEFLHIQDKPIRRWLITQMEATVNRPQLNNTLRHIIMEDLIKAEEFEHFLHSQFIGQKRFSLEGAEVLIPVLHFLVDCAVYRGGEEIVIGMSHRGRLNVLANILNKPSSEIFYEFEAVEIPNLYGGSGDVKYHLGYQRNHVHEDGKFVSVTLASNPSHLESIDPVVEGITRGAQERRNDTGRRRVVPILIHGDAAFSGQGVVAETFNLSQTEGYNTGGTIHIIVNNQIGFTTSSRDARSTFFPTDIAKIIPIPIFHVNGDDPEAVIHVTNLALNFRQEFARDVIIDIFCYRRHGHNEGDEPSFTHPRMYKIIRNHKSVKTLYGDQLEKLNIIPVAEQEEMREKYRVSLKKALEKVNARGKKGDDNPIVSAIKRQNERNKLSFEPVMTGFTLEKLKIIAQKTSAIPDDFHLHSKLKRIIEARQKRFENDGSVDFPLAEILCFGSLLLDGTHIRLSGEDSGRGTFSQRHAVWWDTEADEPKPYIPLNNIEQDQALVAVFDSPLSEYSILGFEYGYSLALPDALVLWEAQFGDFSNGAQVMIDNYIISGEAKWNSTNRLVLLLPHGYEGQGPDHSSAHLERYLHLSAEKNIQVCNVTTPAQFFHMLRRQVKQEASKPLIVMTPKSLLRHPMAVSRTEELTKGHFREVLDDPESSQKPELINALYLCSGKIYYDLIRRRTEAGVRDKAFIRIEQLYPFPYNQLKEILERYGSVRQISWVQEETNNRGGWTYIHDRLIHNYGIQNARYIGREKSASPATGSHARHLREQEAIFSAVFDHQGVTESITKKPTKRRVSSKK